MQSVPNPALSNRLYLFASLAQVAMLLLLVADRIFKVRHPAIMALIALTGFIGFMKIYARTSGIDTGETRVTVAILSLFACIYAIMQAMH